MQKQRVKTSMSVPEMGKMLGLGKVESYWLVKKNYFMTADSDAVEYTLFYQIICCGTTDTQNVLNLIDRIGSFVIADRILFIKAVQFRNSCFKHKNASFIR